MIKKKEKKGNDVCGLIQSFGGPRNVTNTSGWEIFHKDNP